MNKQLKIEITKQTLEEYNKYYFNKYPRRKKEPIPKPIPPSLNQWMILPRMSMNNLKQKWKEFGIWLVEQCGYQNMKIEKAIITYKFFMPTKRRMDNDNMTPKFLNDALVESGFLVDDDCLHVNPIVLWGGYDKENPRTEIIIEILK